MHSLASVKGFVTSFLIMEGCLPTSFWHSIYKFADLDDTRSNANVRHPWIHVHRRAPSKAAEVVDRDGIFHTDRDQHQHRVRSQDRIFRVNPKISPSQEPEVDGGDSNPKARIRQKILQRRRE